MEPKYKRHDSVIILNEPNKDYIEYEGDYLENPKTIKKGTKGKINIIFPNGQYHVALIDEDGNTIAYALFHEEELASEK